MNMNTLRVARLLGVSLETLRATVVLARHFGLGDRGVIRLLNVVAGK